MPCLPHVRNDSHPFSEPIEDLTPGYVVREIIGSDCDSCAGPAPAGVITTGMTSAEIMEALAKFTNTNFFSADTIADATAGVPPNNGEKECPAPQLSSLTKNGTVSGLVSRFRCSDICS